MIRASRVGIVVAMIGALALPSSAEAATSSQALCVAQLRDALSPGVTLSPTTASYTSGGETGSLLCLGSVNGYHVTGAGTIGDSGTVKGSCVTGSVSGALSMTIPTTGGAVALRVPVEAMFAAGIGQRQSEMFPGSFIFVPTRGDCVITPVSEIGVLVLGTLVT